ncbi:MAG: transporter substrate-binding domain-containing protein [Fibromonadaceae bacterium]|jgi:signal transduction histidine kinase/CheY-like chemotaxis protein|nr:transporter substrate-binding domain-containing protein [Fibromonadaceae bacterium]
MKLLFAIILSVLLLSCSDNEKQSYELPVFSSFRDIPGVTEDEIKAIEALQKQEQIFTVGMIPGTEAFVKEDGQIGGYTPLLCDWLSTLFGLRFQAALYEWGDLVEKVTSGEVHFTGEMTATDERRKIYHMSDPIANRMIKIMRLEGSMELSEIAQTRALRYAFLEGTTTVDDVSEHLKPGSYESVHVNDYDAVYSLLKAGTIDAFISENTDEAAFDAHGGVVATNFVPLVFGPVSLTTGIPELAPIISILTKALRNNGIEHLTKLYNLGYNHYLTNKLQRWLTEEEREYIKNNPVIKIGALYYNYPIDFYNEYEKEWQGIMFDLLEEVSVLTGLSFKVATDVSMEQSDLIRELEQGKVSFISELTRMPEMEGRFLWSQRAKLQDDYLLVSKSGLPNLKVNDILNIKVGLIKDHLHTAMFHKWFPDHAYAMEYENLERALGALQNDEVDVLMSSMLQFLAIVNYQEHAGYKVNFVFGLTYDVLSGFNKDEAILLSIIDKALGLVDVYRISEYWLRMNYDYRAKLLQAQRPLLFGAVGLSLIILVLVSVLFVRSRNVGKNLEKQVRLRTNELHSQTMKYKAMEEEARAASRSKSAFLATMSHEIRTPMNSIMGFAELAIDSNSVLQVKGYLEKITDNTKWLLHIINDILDISKIESGKMELEKTPFDLRDIISRCQLVTLPSIKDKGLELKINLEPPVGKKLIGDPVRLYQALLNILSNAVKFTNMGVINFSSLVKKIDNDSVVIYFGIEDTGIGMNEEQIEKIFAPFTQADSSTTRNYGGTGLGLSITKNIVELMGGQLTVKSTPEVGSTFYFEVKFNTIDAADDTADNASFNIVEKPYFNGFVLVCDDNQMNQQVAYEHLARVGIKAVTADNGQIGLDMVRERQEKGEKPFDLILMDIFMPVMDGIEAASKITALNTGTPIVAMTANIMLNEVENYKKNGMLDYIGKPFTSQELWRVLLNYLKPVGSSIVKANEQSEADDSLRWKLQVNFVRKNQNLHDNILEAMHKGDIKLAHRLLHTLKGNAGMIGANRLRELAAELEDSLKDGELPQDKLFGNKINALKNELTLVLEELEPLLVDDKQMDEAQPINTEKTLALFEELEVMFENINPEVVNLLDDIRAIPGTEKMVSHIENYDFESAAVVLAELKKELEENHG